MTQHHPNQDHRSQLTGGLVHNLDDLLAGLVGSLDLPQRRVKWGRTADTEE